MSGIAGGRITTAAGASVLNTQSDRNPECTCFIGSMDVKVTDELLWELGTQVGPVSSVYVPKDRVSGGSQGYGFIEFKSPKDAVYATKVLNMIKLYGKPIRVAPVNQGSEQDGDVGANIFVGNLDPDVDETLLYNTFSAFGTLVKNPKVSRDPETGVSKGFGFIRFSDFEASDRALEVMDGQFLGGRPIQGSYALKKDGHGERHGTPAERLLAQQRALHAGETMRPHAMFSTGPQQAPQAHGVDPLPQAPPQPQWGNQWMGGGPGFATGFVPPPPGMHPMGVPPPPGYVPPPPPRDDIPPPPPEEIPPPPMW